MPKFPRPCLDCGRLTEPGYSRCQQHQAQTDERIALRREIIKQQSGQYSGAYKRLAKIIRQTTLICAICGQGPRLEDPWQADHIHPGQPVLTLSDLQGVHGSCNRKRGNKSL